MCKPAADTLRPAIGAQKHLVSNPLKLVASTFWKPTVTNP